jgi:hypothetical protein
MGWVNMMVFITRCWKNAGIDLGRGCRRISAAWLLGLSCAWGQSANLELTELKVIRQDNALTLTAQLRLELGPVLEDALMKGLALHFVAEADVMRDRWYWTDRKLVTVNRYYRLAFQPLTRRWRLNVSSEPISGTTLAGSISQNFESLHEALGVIRRQSGWRLADVTDLNPEARQYISYAFKLDVSQLPRPFQIAAGNQADWNLQVSKSLRMGKELVR